MRSSSRKFHRIFHHARKLALPEHAVKVLLGHVEERTFFHISLNFRKLISDCVSLPAHTQTPRMLYRLFSTNSPSTSHHFCIYLFYWDDEDGMRKWNKYTRERIWKKVKIKFSPFRRFPGVVSGKFFVFSRIFLNLVSLLLSNLAFSSQTKWCDISEKFSYLFLEFRIIISDGRKSFSWENCLRMTHVGIV